jgi:hypothetical protein
MKCKICGHRTSGENALQNMNKHHRKEHPKARKPRTEKSKSLPAQVFVEQDMKFCPMCGKKKE